MTHRSLPASSLALLLSITAAAPIGARAAVPESTPTVAASSAASVSATAAPLPEPRLVRIRLGDGLALEQVLTGGFDVVGVQGTESVSILAWPKDEARIAPLLARIQVLDEHPGRTQAEAARADMAVLRLRAESLRATPEQAGSATTAPPTFGLGTLGGYWGTNEIKQKLDALVSNDAQDLVADKVDTVGYSREGRPLSTRSPFF